MRVNYLFKIILFFFILIEIKTQKPDKPKKNIKMIDLTQIETGRKSHTIVLTDSNFDSIIGNGTENRWLVIFYSEACAMCKKVKSIIDKIIEEKKYKSVNNIKFDSVDIDFNLRLQTRFDITGIPVLILVENNKMLEISNFPYEQNIIKSIEVEDINIDDQTRDFPVDLSFYEFIKNLVYNSLDQLKEEVNRYINKYNINFEFSVLSLLMFLVYACFIITAIFFYIIKKCFCKEPNNIDKKENNMESEKNINESNKKENKSNVDDVDNADYVGSEEIKKIMEEKKEEEMKEKFNKEKENIINNMEQPKKKEKKKKKE
jgi:hypothetical protein